MSLWPEGTVFESGFQCEVVRSSFGPGLRSQGRACALLSTLGLEGAPLRLADLKTESAFLLGAWMVSHVSKSQKSAI